MIRQAGHHLEDRMAAKRTALESILEKPRRTFGRDSEWLVGAQ